MQSQYFIFNEIKSSDMGVSNVRIAKAESLIEIFGGKDILTENFGYSNKNFIYGSKNDTLSFDLLLMSKDGTWSNKEISNIMNWLMTDDYKEFRSGDNIDKIYYGIVTSKINLNMVNNYGCIPIHIETNSNCGYTPIIEETINVKDEIIYELNNISNVGNKYYYPELVITFKDSNKLTIVNTSDEDRTFEITGYNKETVIIDNEFALFKSELPYDYYGNFNKNWFRLKKGLNRLKIKGNCEIKIIAQFPII